MVDSSWKKIAAILLVLAAGVGGLSQTALFGALFLLNGVNSTHSGDITCGETCESFVNVTSSYWTVCFEHSNNSQVMYQKGVGKKLWVNLNNVSSVISTEPKVTVDWLVKNGTKWVPVYDGYCWKTGKINQNKLVGHKLPWESIKWGVVMGEDGKYVSIDPVWSGEPAVLNMTFNNADGVYNSTLSQNLGSGLNATVVGAVNTTTGGCGGSGAYVFNYSVHLAALNYRTISSDAKSVSACAWIKSKPKVTGITHMIVAHYNSANGNRSWTMHMTEAQLGVFLSTSGNSATKNYVTGSLDIDDDNWHHVCFTYNGDADALWLYHNGRNQSVTKTADGAMSTIRVTDFNVTIGAKGTAGVINDFFNGTIDEVLVFNYTLSNESVLALYNSYIRCAGPDWYFSQSGNDATGDGSIGNPYKTIAKLNTLSLNPGDSVLFKRGEVWRLPADAYISVDSGSAAGNVTYGAYGAGNKPLFLGSYEANSANNWTEVGSNIWKTNFTIAADVGNVIFNNEASVGRKRSSYADMTQQGDFFYNSSTDYTFMYSSGNPASYYSDIELAQRVHMFNAENKDYVIFENLDLRYSGAHGISLKGSYLYVLNSEFSYIGGSYQSGTLRYGNCVEFGLESSNTKVLYNNFSQCYDAAVTYQAWTTGDGGVFIGNAEIAYNIISYSEYGYEYFNSIDDAGASTDNILIHHNTFINQGEGWGSAARGSPYPSDLRMPKTPSATTNIVIRDNIFYDASYRSINLEGSGSTLWEGDEPLANNNLYYFAYDVGTNMITWNATSYKNITAFKTIGHEANGVQYYNDSVFTDLSGGDYTPLTGSIACSMSSTGDYVGALPCAEEPTDTCTYSGSGNWNCDCSTQHFITTSYSLPNNNFTATGAGTLTLSANLTAKSIWAGDGCNLILNNSVPNIRAWAGS